MSKVRQLLSGTILGLLGLGYLASQYTALYGDAADYSARIDRSEVKFLSLALLVAALFCAVRPDRGSPP